MFTTRLIGRTSATAAVATLLLTAVAVPSYADIVGNDNDNVLHGNDNPNVIFGRGGDDELYGHGGADELHGQLGADLLKGGLGSDRLNGGQGRDVLDGDQGDDLLYADDPADRDVTGGDRVRAGLDDDTVWSRDGERDTVTCGDGNLDLAILDDRDDLTANHGCERVSRRPDVRRSDDSELAARATEWAIAYAGRTQGYLANTTQELDQWTARTGLTGDNFDWCGIYVHEAYWKAGQDLADGIRSTDWLFGVMAAGGTAHLQRVAINNIRRGDILLIDWPQQGDAHDHIALATSDHDGGTSITTISGNTGIDGGARGVGFDTISTSTIVYAIRVQP